MESKGPLVKVKSVIFTLSVGLFLFYQLASFKELGFFLSTISMVAIALSVMSCPFFTRLMSIIFLLLGTFMVARKEIDFSTYVLLYGNMLYLLALFARSPFIVYTHSGRWVQGSF
ncbi:hypothetical protein ACM6Q7_13430 [Peribacillus butanolivorans]